MAVPKNDDQNQESRPIVHYGRLPPLHWFNANNAVHFMLPIEHARRVGITTAFL